MKFKQLGAQSISILTSFSEIYNGFYHLLEVQQQISISNSFLDQDLQLPSAPCCQSVPSNQVGKGHFLET